jgi:rfaE bifunctional protein nucleotidyltransferase chain/domain
MRTPTAKVLDWPDLPALRARSTAEGKTIVWTTGCFDLMHPGHIRSLQAARLLGDLLVVGVNGDTSVHALKGPGRPVLRAAERVEVLAALECVDYVAVFEELRPDVALLRLKPDVHCKGAEYAPPHGKPIPEAAVVAAYGGRVEFLPFIPGISTTEIIRRIREVDGFPARAQAPR